MKNLCTVLVLLVVGGGILGFFRSWFHLSSESTDKTVEFNLTVDKEKLNADKEVAQEQIAIVARKLQEKVLELTGKSKKETAESVDQRIGIKPVP